MATAQPDGERDVPTWSADRGAKLAHVLTDLKTRGVQDILFVCVDGLTGFVEAIEATFPHATVQTCLVHQVAECGCPTPGRPSITDEHYPPRPAGALQRRPRARSEEERAFLGLGDGAEAWLIKAGAAGAQRVRRKMAEAVDLAKLHGTDEVGHALKRCADAGRFGDGDLAQVLTHQQQAGELIPFPARSEEHSLQRSTKSWEGLGR